MPPKSNKEGFIKKSKLHHEDKYDYSLVNYIDNNTKVKIICPEHGVFEQIPRSHSSGTRCRQCVFDSYKSPFIECSKKIYGDKYDYSLVKYTSRHTEVKIICPDHGVFEKRPDSFMKGHGCKQCASIKRAKDNKANFINRASKIHDGKYDYSLVEYTETHSKVKITCPIHGGFQQDPHNHLKGKGCSKCNDSIGEREVRKFLKKKKVKFTCQKKFDGCKHKALLRFDFYLSEHNLCIEYNGPQHYVSVDIFGGEEGFKLTKKRDIIKKRYCSTNNIGLFIIKHGKLQESLLRLESNYLIG